MVGLLAFIINSGLFFYTYFRNPRQPANRAFCAVVGMLAIWSLGDFLLYLLPSSALFLTAFRFISITWLLLPALIFRFALLFTNNRPLKNPGILAGIWGGPIFFYGLSLFTNTVVSGAGINVFGYYLIYSWGFVAFTAYFFMLMAGSIFLLLRFARGQVPKSQKLSAWFIVAGFTVPLAGGTVTNIALPLLHITGPYTAIFLTTVQALIISYGIKKHGIISWEKKLLMEIEGLRKILAAIHKVTQSPEPVPLLPDLVKIAAEISQSPFAVLVYRPAHQPPEIFFGIPDPRLQGLAARPDLVAGLKDLPPGTFPLASARLGALPLGPLTHLHNHSLFRTPAGEAWLILFYEDFPENISITEFFAAQCGSALMQSILIRELRNSRDSLQQTIAELQNKNRQLDQTQSAILKNEQTMAIGRFVSGLIQELKQPVLGLGGFLGLINRTDNIDKIKGYAQSMDRGIQRMAELLENLREFSATPREIIVGYDIQEQILRAKDLVHAHLVQKNIEWNADLEPCRTRGYPRKMQTVFVNIFTNAIEAMEKNGPGETNILRVSCHPVSDQSLRICIEDSGGGLGPVQPHQAFEAFFTAKMGAAGLGLTFCKNIIENHRGTITLEPHFPRGLRVVIELPYRP
jgi:signal transduction histidine kinase